jgi:tetratricopeptide (TPR) repeat protein
VQRSHGLVEVGRNAEAIDLLQRALAANPNEPALLEALAEAQLSVDPKAALETAGRLSARLPEHFRGHQLLALASSALRRDKQAVAHARDAVAAAPDRAGSHILLADTLARRRKTREARKAAARALELAPDRANSHVVSGNVELAAGHSSRAERAYRRALELDPYNATAQQNLVIAQKAGNKLASALSTAHGRVRFDPSDDTSRRQLDGVVYSTLVHLQWLVALLAFIVLVLRAG